MGVVKLKCFNLISHSQLVMWRKCLRWSTLGGIYHSYTGNVFSLFCKAHHYFLITLFISIREIGSSLEGMPKFFTNDVFFSSIELNARCTKNEKIFQLKSFHSKRHHNSLIQIQIFTRPTDFTRGSESSMVLQFGSPSTL